MMKFIETRGNDGIHSQEITFSEAILSPIASFGGLYVPKALPELGEAFLTKHLNSSYKVLAKDMLMTLGIDIEESVIDEALALYDKFDDPTNPVPVVKVRDDLYVSELYHGPTRAFKDMALQPFGIVLSSIAQK
jgi:threonine synthase